MSRYRGPISGGVMGRLERTVRQPKVHSVTLLVREKGTAAPFEPREYLTTLQTPTKQLAECIRYAESRGLEVSRPH